MNQLNMLKNLNSIKLSEPFKYNDRILLTEAMETLIKLNCNNEEFFGNKNFNFGL